MLFNSPVEDGLRRQESLQGTMSRPRSTRFPFEGPRGKGIRERLVKEAAGILAPRGRRNRSTILEDEKPSRVIARSSPAATTGTVCS